MSQRQEKRISEFVRLTEPCHKQLFGIALSLCKDADKANDLTQETLIRAFQAFDTFHREAPIMPWLRRILRNVFLDSFKTGRAQHEVVERDLGSDTLLSQAAAEHTDPLVQIERSQLSGWLREAIATLDPTQQQVVELCIMQDLSFEEAAEMAGIPVGTIASRLARARIKLRERLQKRAAETLHTKGPGRQSLFLDKKEAPPRNPSGSPGQISPATDEAALRAGKQEKGSP